MIRPFGQAIDQKTDRPDTGADRATAIGGLLDGLGDPSRRFRFRVEIAWQWLRRCLQEERDHGRISLWAPVVFIAGIGGYFVLPNEPAALALFAAASLAGLVAWRQAFVGRPHALATCLFLFLAGMAAAKHETDRELAPRLDGTLFVSITGTLERVEPAKRNRWRLTVRPTHIEGLAAADLPARIRVSARRGTEPLRPGTAVSFRARLQPPSGPVYPGGFDFSRAAYFDQRGAGGFVIGTVSAVPEPKFDQAGLSVARAAIERFRTAFAERIAKSLPGQEGTIAQALIVGQRQAIPETVADDLRIAGLAHILAISGLHMVLLTGSVFWAARAVLAASPRLALNWPIKKWAAGIALLAGLCYLAVSGASVATQRAFIMVAVAFFAVFLDRPALTMRTLAVAAFIVALIYPHTVMGPSFQMSFLAACALIGLSEWVSARLPAPANAAASLPVRVWASVRLYALGLLVTSFLAGAATGPVAAYHFHTLAPLGLLGNLLAMPIVGLVIMPMGLLACLAIPFGLDVPFFWLMGLGIHAVTTLSHWVAGLSEGAEYTGLIPLATPFFAAAGLLWMTIWRTGLRWAGIGFIAVALAAAPFASIPDVLVSRTGEAIAVQPASGPLVILRKGTAAFEARIWLRAYADNRSERDRSLADGVLCDTAGCAYRLPVKVGSKADAARILALSFQKEAMWEDCHRANILVTRHMAPDFCPRPSVILDRDRLARTGAVSISFAEDGNPIVTPARGPSTRPWHDPSQFLDRTGRSGAP